MQLKISPYIKRKFTTFQKIYLSYLLICAVPVLLLASAFGISTNSFIHNRIDKERAHASELVAQTVDNEFSRLQRIGQQLFNTEWVKKRATSGELYEEEFSFKKKRAISNDLRGYVVTSGLIRSLSMVFPEKGEVYSSIGYYNEGDFFHRFSLERSQIPLESAVVYERIKMPENNGFVFGSSLGMTGKYSEQLFYVEAQKYGPPMRSFMLIEISSSAMRNSVDLVRSKDMVRFEIRKGEKALTSLRFANEEPTQEYINNATCCPVRFVTSYSKAVYSGSEFMLLGTLVLISILLVINLAWLLSRSRYQPLKKLVTILTGKSLVQADGAADEYQLIEESLYNLCEERDDMLRKAEQYRATARANFLRRLLQGYFDSDDAAKKMREFDIAFTERLVHIVLLVEENQCVTAGASRPLEEALSTFDYLYEIVELGKTRYAIIMALEPEQKKRFNGGAVEASIRLSYSEQHTKSAITLVAGTHEIGLLGIAKSYYVANEVLSAHSGANRGRVTLYKDCYYPTEWELQLINRLKARHQKPTLTILNEIKAENEKRSISAHHMRQLVMMIAETFSKVINEFDANLEGYNDLYETINSNADIESLWHSLFAICELFCVERSTGEELENTERQIVNYVKENFTDPNLSLKELGDRYSLSVSAISKMFKRVCGINFYEFLLSSRMELAIEMFENQKLSLIVIARAVGYENEYSFKRAFSRFYGMSVTDYLHKHKK